MLTDCPHSWLRSRHTTPDVLANFSDLKVLGKGDFKLLMKWRLAIRLEFGMDVKADRTEDVTEEVTVEPMDEEEQISEEVSFLETHTHPPPKNHPNKWDLTNVVTATSYVRGKNQSAEEGAQEGQREEGSRASEAAAQHDRTNRPG